MKESISYTFLLNIVIVFIFISFAIIMGVFSYYKAFRANTIIVNAIEKYEGYNCASKEEINEKLSGIGYNVPFTPKCKSDEKNCVVDEQNKYKIVPYNLDGPTDGEYVNDITGSIFVDEDRDNQTRYYKYAVTTYMYIDLPVVNQLIRLSFVSKTNTMYEFRKILRRDDGTGKYYYDGKLKIVDSNLGETSQMILHEYSSAQTDNDTDNRIQSVDDPEYSARKRAKFDVDGDGKTTATDASYAGGAYKDLTQKYMTCEMIKSYDNY